MQRTQCAPRMQVSTSIMGCGRLSTPKRPLISPTGSMAQHQQGAANWVSTSSPRRSRTHRRATSAEGAGADGIVFGKPQAPQEVWEGIARSARAELQKQVDHLDGLGGGGGDVVLAALEIASEDDAVKTRTHIPLPVESFSQRLDSIVGECRSQLSSSQTPVEQVSVVTHHLFNTWGLRMSKDMNDGLYSPYRVYMHQVLAQRCGTQVACAAILHALLDRLQVCGALPSQHQYTVGLPSSPQHPPVVSLAEGSTTWVVGSEGLMGPDSAAQAVALGLRWVGGNELLCELLDQLKRSFWSWDWPLGAASGFDTCARSLLGEGGRAGRVSAAVGVMQAQGRPFGDVTLALLATERMVLVTKAIEADSWAHQLQARDYGAQLLHVGRTQEGLRLLSDYQAWLAKDGRSDGIIIMPGTKPSTTPGTLRHVPMTAAAAVSGSDLVNQVVLEEQRKLLEAQI